MAYDPFQENPYYDSFRDSEDPESSHTMGAGPHHKQPHPHGVPYYPATQHHHSAAYYHVAPYQPAPHYAPKVHHAQAQQPHHCMHPCHHSYQPKTSCITDPYVVHTLKAIVGKMVVVDTGKGTLRGKLQQVKPDHIVLREPDGKSTFYVRLQKIVWIMPD